MKTAIPVVVTFVLIAAISAGIKWGLNYQKGADEAEKSEGAKTGDDLVVDTGVKPPPQTASDRVPTALAPSVVDGSGELADLIERNSRYSQSLRLQTMMTAERNAFLRDVLDDTREIQKSIDNAKQTVAAQMDAFNKIMTEKAKVEAAKPPELTAEELPRIKKVAVIYEGMAPEAAAAIFATMVQDGFELTVVKLLDSMQARKASKVIEEINNTDKALAAKLTEELEILRRPAKPGAA